MKKVIQIAVWVSIVLIALSFFKDAVVKSIVEKAVELVAGLQLNMKSLKVGIAQSTISIKGLELFNPKGFKDRIMLDMPEVYVAYDPFSIMKGKIHLRKVHISLNEFVVVKNEDGELNLDSLKALRVSKKTRGVKEKKPEPPSIQIDDLRLKIGKAIYKDYSNGEPPSIREFNINIDERYANIRDPYTLVSLIVVRALSNTTVSRLADFDLDGLKGTISGTLSSVQDIAQKTVSVTRETIKKTTEETKGIVKGARETIKKTTKNLEEVLRAPFGSKD